MDIKEVLEGHGFAVETASSAMAGKDALKTAIFDVVITDLKMETPTAGYEVVQAAVSKKPAPATIIMSAYPAFGYDWHQHGANAFFEKPVPIQQLLRKSNSFSTATGAQPPASKVQDQHDSVKLARLVLRTLNSD